MKFIKLAGCSIYLLLVLALNGCAGKTEHAAELQSFRKQGDSISVLSQQTIFTKLTAAIARGGMAYAVDFCSVNAMPLTDSLSSIFNTRIRRLSNKNRNPANKLTGETDLAVFAYFRDHMKEGVKDTVLREGAGYAYYKPIRIAMPACLSCHGNPKLDIDSQMAKIIREKYPTDLATGYQSGELRGMWKIEFRKNAE